MTDLNQHLQELHRRVQRCRCKYCGGALEVRKVFFGTVETARTEIFCVKCDRIEYGVEAEIYSIAQYYVKEYQFNYFPDLDHDAQTERLNIARVCEIMSWFSQSIGILDSNGFPPIIKDFWGENTILLNANEIIEEC